MTVETQLLDVPFTGGLAQNTREELVMPPALLRLQNLRMVTRGSYQKRPGNVSLGAPVDTAGVAFPAAKRLIAYRDEICSTDHLNLYSRLSGFGGRWKKVAGRAPQLNISVTPVGSVQYFLISHHVIGVNGYQVLVYAATTSNSSTATSMIYASVLDANGVVLVPAVAILPAAFAQVPVVAVASAGNVAVVCWTRLSLGNVYMTTLDTTSVATILAGWSGVTTPITDASVGQYLIGASLDAISLGSTFAVAYVNVRADTILTREVTITTFNSALTLQATNNTLNTSLTATGAVTAVSISGDVADTLFVAYAVDDSTVFRVGALNPTTLAQTAAGVTLTATPLTGIMECTVLRTGTGTGIVLVVDATGACQIRQFTQSGLTIAGVGAGVFRFWGMAFSTRAFMSNGRAYIAMRPMLTAGSATADPSQLLVIDLTATLADAAALASGYLRVAGNITPRLTQHPFQDSAFGIPLSTVSTLSSTKVLIPKATRKNASGASMDLALLDWSTSFPGQPAVVGEAVALGGAPPSMYDGATVFELGFFQRPVILSNALTTKTTAFAPAAGVYNYVAVYEQLDARGQWHQSNISDVYLSNPQPDGTKANSLTVTALAASNRSDGQSPAVSAQFARVALYRTKDAGTVFYRVVSGETTTLPSAASLVVVDNCADSQLGAPLYTQPGIPGAALVKVAPPGLSCLVTHADRLVGAVGKDVWFSGQFIPGEGPWFSDLFQFNVGTTGDVTALASMDGALFVFKRDSIYVVDGQGPADNGAGEFSPPQLVSSEVGGISQDSIVVTPDGIVFQSLRGLELMTRARQIAPFFGNPVVGLITAWPIVTSAVLDQAECEVTFTCTRAVDPTLGISLTWNYDFGVWTSGLPSDGTTDGIAVPSAIMWGQNTGTTPIRTWLDTAGVVYQESTSTHLDNTRWVTTVLETPWLKGAGVAGLQLASSAVLQAQSLSAHDLTVEVAYDYSPTYTDTHVWTAAEIAALTTANEALQFDLVSPECTTFRVRMTDSRPSSSVGTGQGPLYFGMEAEVGLNGKLLLLPEANRK